MKIILGLGNPGKEYEETYHNVGALAVQSLAHRALGGTIPFEIHKKLGKKLFSYLDVEEGTAHQVFVIPLVYMNQSGAAAREALKKFSARPTDLVVIHDESDLPIGTYKASVSRGAAGHKGVQSIMDALKTDAFTRIRIGIRNPQEKARAKAGAFVLKKISAKDRRTFEALFAKL